MGFRFFWLLVCLFILKLRSIFLNEHSRRAVCFFLSVAKIYLREFIDDYKFSSLQTKNVTLEEAKIQLELAKSIF